MSHRTRSTIAVVTVWLAVCAAHAGGPIDVAPADSPTSAFATLGWHPSDLERTAPGETIVAVLDDGRGEPLHVELEPFPILAPDARFVLGRRGGPDVELPFDATQLTVLRGAVSGYPDSSALLAIHPERASGYVELAPGGRRWRADPTSGADVATGSVALFEAGPAAPSTISPDVPECGTVGTAHASSPAAAAVEFSATTGRPDLRRIELAVDTDHEFFSLFDDAADASLYVAQLYAEVSAIFMRDINTRIELVFVRLWDQPDDLFNDVDPSPLSDFRNTWNNEMTAVDRDVVQLISGRRDYPFGGQAYLSSICGTNGYSVVGYAAGAFPDPAQPSPYNYDIAVTAHEIGHNAGTGHTHDAANGIDDCANTASTPQRGTIMSYCGQTWSGGNANRDLWFHTIIRDNMRGHVYSRACVDFDCNQNGVDDAADIAATTSADLDGNGVPDECEDCNGNATLDDADIAMGTSADVDGDGVPDECQADCDADGIPDSKEIADGTAVDAYGNGIPDACEADCDGDGTPDYDEIQLSMPLDIDRNRVLDACQDCDGDGTPDLIELGSAHSVWVGSGLVDEPLRRFTPASGVLADTSGPSGALVEQTQDVIIAPDGRVLVSAGAGNRVLAFDADGLSLGDLVPAGASAPSFAAGLVWRDDGTLLVASRDSNEVLAYDGTTGAPLGALVPAGGNGPTAPFAMTIGPDGRLYVADEANEIRRFDLTTGAFVDLFVSAVANGGLDRPRGMTFKRDGHLLVTSFGTNRVLEFEGATGIPMGPWSNVGTPTRLTQVSPWGVRIGPNGNVFVARTGEAYGSTSRGAGASHADEHAHEKHEHGDDDEHIVVLHLTNAQIYEYDVATGDFIRSYIGGNDHGLLFATGFAFAPGDAADCNRNGLPDGCDLVSGHSADGDGNLQPDECEVDCDGDGTADRIEVVPFGTELDCNYNGVLDSCDLAAGTSVDCNQDAVPDECQIDDPVELGLGWSVGAPGDDATTGIWTLDDPNGTAAQPEDDHTPAGRKCFFTGQGSVGGTDGEADVDGGTTTLFSPLIDLADEPEAFISYWRWYSNSVGGNPGQDVFVVDVSNDAGQSWFNVETVGPTGPGTSGVWARHRFRVADVVTPTASVQLRFVASDLGGGSIVEAAIDDLDVERACPCAGSSPVPEVTGVTVRQGPAGAIELNWDSAGYDRHYDVIGGPIDTLQTSGGVGGASCLVEDVDDPSWIDDDPDPVGIYYVVRAEDACSMGTWGNPPAGPPRDPVAPCP